jgi:hypothetical protein
MAQERLIDECTDIVWTERNGIRAAFMDRKRR